MPMKVYEITFEKDFKVSFKTQLEMTMVFSEETETLLYFANEEKERFSPLLCHPIN
jgi:hypothetical protein